VAGNWDGIEIVDEHHNAAKFPAAMLREVEREFSMCCTVNGAAGGGDHGLLCCLQRWRLL
jgi:hypothetical protein